MRSRVLRGMYFFVLSSIFDRITSSIFLKRYSKSRRSLLLLLLLTPVAFWTNGDPGCSGLLLPPKESPDMFCSNVHWGSPLFKVFAPVGRPDKSDIPCSGVLIEGNRNSNYHVAQTNRAMGGWVDGWRKYIHTIELFAAFLEVPF
jgi:hypothetical protein